MSFGSKSGSEFLENIISSVNPVTRRNMWRVDIMSLSANTREVVMERNTTLFNSYIKIMYKSRIWLQKEISRNRFSYKRNPLKL
jgi:hypothetical protein